MSESMAPSHPALAHHFDSLRQQHEASHLGMWVFLVTEIMFFGGVFTVYLVYRTFYPDAFADASRHLDLVLGGLNTIVLICSSLTMALAVYSAQVGNRKMLMRFLVLTLLLGMVFLGIKAVEYAQKFEHHLVPGTAFTYPGPFAKQAQLFFSIYFAMTGVHALHMVIGIGVLAFLILQTRRGMYTPEHHSMVELSGLYWHFVDIIWIFLFPMLYLVGRHLKN